MTAAPLNPHLAGVFAPPVMEARRWLAETALPPEHALLNLSQAAPVDPPPERLRRAMADALAGEGDAHLYGAVLGDTPLRDQIAADWSGHYGADISPRNVAVTAGCNQAFCAAIATLCSPGDAVLLPIPWYFNHKMWLDMCGVEAVPVPCGAGMLPDLEAARDLIGPRTRALVLVTPNNPTGAEYPPALMEAAFDLAEETGLGLVVDETYRDFHSGEGAPHALFARDNWEETLLHLYSFSKVFRLTGHRTGALITGRQRLSEAEKFLDTVTICPPRTGQIAALEGLRALRQWVSGERAEILARRDALRTVFAGLQGWTVKGSGAYFAWVEAPFEIESTRLARRLLEDQAILTLPGSMFVPDSSPETGARALRIAFANADADGLAEMGRRLARFAP